MSEAVGSTDRRVFVVMRTHGARWQASQPLEGQVDWAGHAAFMDALVEDGFVVLGGPLDGADAALVVVRAESADAVRARLADDPWVRLDLLSDTLVAPWTLRLGSLDT